MMANLGKAAFLRRTEGNGRSIKRQLADILHLEQALYCTKNVCYIGEVKI